MRYVLGVVVAVVMVGCGSEPGPIGPSCEGTSFAACPEGMAAACDPTLTQATFVNRTQCVGTGVVEGSDDAARCVEGSPVCDSGAVPVCTEAGSDDPADCARWAAGCAAMDADRCYVAAGTDDVIPY